MYVYCTTYPSPVYARGWLDSCSAISTTVEIDYRLRVSMEEKVCDRYSLYRPGASERDLDAVQLAIVKKTI
ncbi:hypothetical protein GCM10009000_091910 [Halobacterium noricense]|uniref:Uncharacterized protein n=1 Tax=Haladaptatus pallidirubidus TaxID=1008152 RepID=A0AAV3UIC0_9EURY